MVSKTTAPKSTTPPVKKAAAPTTPEVVTEAKVRVITAGRATDAACPAGLADKQYTIKGGSNYNPRVTHTQEAWSKMQKVFGIKGVATHKQLCDALASHFTHAGENHHDFIGYMVRRSAILEVAAKASK
jgi:hypothetical protein